MLPFALVDRQTSKQTNKRCCKYRMDVRTPDLEIEQTAEIVVEVDMMLVADELEDADLLAIVANACHTRINTEELLSISCHHSVILLTKKHREGWATKTQERPPSCDTGFAAPLRTVIIVISSRCPTQQCLSDVGASNTCAG